MKIYLAAAWSRREQMKALAEELERDIPGLIVNARWIKEEPSSNRWFVQDAAKNASINREPTGHNQFDLRRFRAQQDRDDVLSSDVLVRFTDDLTPETVPSYLATGSRMVEMGMAIIAGVKVIVVGGFQPIFDYLPEVQHVKNTEELKDALRHTSSAKDN